MITDALKNHLSDQLKILHRQDLTDSLFHYLELLHKWNKAYNLTAIRSPLEMISKHVMDSLAILPWIHGQRIIDVGTGPGLPGIPLALANPDYHVTLLDSNGKKTRFLTEVKRTLGLDNIEIVESRVENYRPSAGFDTVVSRAFSSLSQMITWTSHLVAQQGIWLAMKGIYPEEELKSLSRPWQVEEYEVPLCPGKRCCILIKNNNNQDYTS